VNELFRKHGKWILAVLGVALMVIWLIPNKNKGDTGADIEIGRLAGKKVMRSANEYVYAANDVILLQHLAPNAYKYPGLGRFSVFLDQLDRRQPELHLYLLLREAETYHLTATGDEVQSVIVNLGLKQSEFEDLLKPFGGDSTLFSRAVRDYLIVNKLNDLAFSVLRPSLPELRHLASDLRSQVSVRYLTLDAHDPAGAIPTPTEEQVTTQFDTYKDVLPTLPGPRGQIEPPLVGGHHYPFAYKYPDRVQVEYLVFEHQAIRDLVAAGLTPAQKQEDALAAYQYYTANPDKFKNTPPASTEPAASQPALKPYESVAADLMNAQLEIRVERLMKLMTDDATKQAGEPWHAMTDDGYRAAVPEANWVGYDKIADNLAQQAKYRKYHPLVGQPGAWLAQANLRDLKGIGSAGLVVRDRGYGFPLLALHVKEIATDLKDPILRPLQTGVEGPVLSDAQKNQYVYRVTAAQAAHRPATPAEIAEKREQAALDVRRRLTFEQDVQRGQVLAQEAATAHLETIAQREHLTIATEPPFTLLTEQPITYTLSIPVPRPLETLGLVPAFSQAAADLGQASLAATPATGPGATQAATSAPATSPAATRLADLLPPGARTSSVSVEALLKVFVLELASYSPLPVSEFDRRGTREDIENLAQAEAIRAFAKWNTLEAAAQRVDFTPARPFREE
jgi:hypothetical protein